MPILTYTTRDGRTAELWCKLHHPDTVARALRAYERGGRPQAIARRLGVSVSTIEKWCVRAGVTRSRRDAALTRIADERGITRGELTALRAEAERLYLSEGLGLCPIARRLGFSPTTVRAWLKRRGVLRRRERMIGYRPRILPAAERAALQARAVRLYRAGLTAAQVADVLGSRAGTVYAWLRRAGVQRDRRTALLLRWRSPASLDGRRRRALARRAWRLRGEGERAAEIARALNTTPQTVAALLRADFALPIEAAAAAAPLTPALP